MKTPPGIKSGGRFLSRLWGIDRFRLSIVLPDPDHLADAGQGLDLPFVQGIGVADHPDDGAVRAGGLVDVEAVVDQVFLDGVQRLFGGVLFRDDQHSSRPSRCDMMRSSRRDSSTTRSNRRMMAPSSSGPGLSSFMRTKMRFSRAGSNTGRSNPFLRFPISRASLARSLKIRSSTSSSRSIRFRTSSISTPTSLERYREVSGAASGPRRFRFPQSYSLHAVTATSAAGWGSAPARARILFPP